MRLGKEPGNQARFRILRSDGLKGRWGRSNLIVNQ
jgi:hypothetical protein